MKGLEPPRLAAPDPKSGAATNYATSAFFWYNWEAKIMFFVLENKIYDNFILVAMKLSSAESIILGLWVGVGPVRIPVLTVKETLCVGYFDCDSSKDSHIAWKGSVAIV